MSCTHLYRHHIERLGVRIGFTACGIAIAPHVVVDGAGRAISPQPRVVASAEVLNREPNRCWHCSDLAGKVLAHRPLRRREARADALARKYLAAGGSA